MTNEDKVNNYKKRKVLRYLIIIFGLATLVLAIFKEFVYFYF